MDTNAISGSGVQQQSMPGCFLAKPVAVWMIRSRRPFSRINRADRRLSSDAVSGKLLEHAMEAVVARGRGLARIRVAARDDGHLVSRGPGHPFFPSFGRR